MLPIWLLLLLQSSSHCMIVPITCPAPADEWKYSMEYISTQYELHQHLTCYVYRDIPETPLLIKTPIFSHISPALLILTMLPIAILSSVIICLVTRPTNEQHETNCELSSEHCDSPLVPQWYSICIFNCQYCNVMCSFSRIFKVRLWQYLLLALDYTTWASYWSWLNLTNLSVEFQ